jgi:cytidylate kinase
VRCQAVCISATDGSSGEQVGQLVAGGLGFRLINEELISRAANRAGVAPHEVADVERRRSFVRRMLEELAPGTVMAGMAYGAVVPQEVDLGARNDEMRAFIRRAIEDVAAEGEAVIVSHAASFALADHHGVLRVLVTAAPSTRNRRLAEERGVDDGEAARLVKSGDANRRDYLKRFYDIPAEMPTQYDLVLNTDRLTPEQAADLIVRVAQS